MRERSDHPPFSELRFQLRRPRILIVFCWLLILSGTLTPLSLAHIDEFPSLFPLDQSRFPRDVHYLVIAASGALRVACGAGLLSGYEWSRFVWVFVSFALAGFDVFAFPPTARILVPSFLVPVLSLYFLFRPAINDYFVAVSSQNYPDPDAR
jgi:hypothetical protein